MGSKEVSVLIPAYNEENAIEPVIRETDEVLKASGWRYEIIVIDDCSRDKTADVASKTGVKVVRHPKNAGYGGALRTGILNASYEWIATIDADRSYPPNELLKLFPYAASFEMVVGARQGVHFWGSLLKFPARLLFLAIAQFVVGERIPDVNSGLRLFKKAIVREMLPRLSRGFSFSTTITLSFMSSHHFVKFVPIDYNMRVGSSKVRYIRDTLRTLQLMLETIVFYNPIKAMLLLALFPFGCFVAGTVVSMIEWDPLWFFFAMLSAFVSLHLLAIGCVLFVLTKMRPIDNHD